VIALVFSSKRAAVEYEYTTPNTTRGGEFWFVTGSRAREEGRSFCFCAGCCAQLHAAYILHTQT